MSGKSKRPIFDGPAFAQILKNHMASKGLSVEELAVRAGVGRSSLQTLRRGAPTNAEVASGQKGLHPSIDLLAAVAEGLEQRLSNVLRWAGIEDEGDRFSAAERRVLATLLGGEPADVDALLRALVNSESASKES